MNACKKIFIFYIFMIIVSFYPVSGQRSNAAVVACDSYCKDNVYYSRGTYDSIARLCEYAVKEICVSGCNVERSGCMIMLTPRSLMDPIRPLLPAVQSEERPTQNSRKGPQSEDKENNDNVVASFRNSFINASNVLDNSRVKVWESGGRIKEAKVIVNNEEKETEIETNNVKATTKQKLEIKNSQIYLNQHPVHITPDTAVFKAVEKTGMAFDKAELILNDNKKPAYRVKGRVQAQILWFIKVNMPLRIDVDAESGKIGEVSKPWWGFIASIPTVLENKAYCAIEGVSYKIGDSNPSNKCQTCNPLVSKNSWSNCKFDGAFYHFNGTKEHKEFLENNGYKVSGEEGDYKVGNFPSSEIPYKCYSEEEATPCISFESNENGSASGLFQCVNGKWEPGNCLAPPNISDQAPISGQEPLE